MKNQFTFLAALIFVVSLPLTALAASHEHNKQGMDHGKMDHAGHDHAGMDAHGDMIILGDDTEAGVRGMAHLKDVGAAMSKMGMETTHHIMLMFVDNKSGEPITKGAAAVKITGPDGKTSAPIRLMGMQGHFGADTVLKQKGEYTLVVGTKLADDQKRTFEFKHTLK
ncbi:MAG: hypothetical protein WDA20_08115 [Desulfuromonadales bacterium]